MVQRKRNSAIEVAGIRVVEVNQNYFELKYKLKWNGNLKRYSVSSLAKPEGNKVKKYPLLDFTSSQFGIETG
jgi:hypothetical protein